MELTKETQLPNTWYLWYHQYPNDFTIKGFKNIYQIKTVEDYWNLHNSWKQNGGIIKNQFYIMKENIKPMWEDPENSKGGRWSFKVKLSQAQNLWNDLATYLVSGNLIKNPDEVTGISCSIKKKSWAVIKIWNNNQKNTSLKNINDDILKKWGLEIIYIANVI